MDFVTDGFLSVLKPRGITSFDVIRRVRPLLGKGVKIGHAGVIDKPAAGVLPLGLGRATRLFGVLSDFTKDYFTWLAFGVTSPTLDLGSDVEAVAPPRSQAEASELALRILEILPRFVGAIEQVPPAYSNVKVNGRELYKYELKNEPVDLVPRKVTVERIVCTAMYYCDSAGLYPLDIPQSSAGNHALSYSLPKLELPIDVKMPSPVLIAEMFIECGTGTYVRVIARDIAIATCSGGLVASLMRTRVGPFVYTSSVALDELTNALSQDRDKALLLHLYPMSRVAPSDSLVTVYHEEAQNLSNGNPVFVQVHRLPQRIVKDDTGTAKVYAVLEDGRLVASCSASERQTRPDIWVLRPNKVFLK